MKPFLQDLYFCSEIHGHDTVIGLIKYERHCVFQDENGRDLRDTIHLEILKKEAELSRENFLFLQGISILKITLTGRKKL